MSSYSMELDRTRPLDSSPLPAVLQCRPVDCRNDDENCVECARRRPLTCAACDWGYKVANGKVR